MTRNEFTQKYGQILCPLVTPYDTNEEVLKPLIEKQIQKYLKPILLEKTEIAFAKHGNNAGILGAFYNFKKYYRKEKNKEARAFET